MNHKDKNYDGGMLVFARRAGLMAGMAACINILSLFASETAVVVDLTPKTPNKPGEVVIIDFGLGVTMELVWIPAGEFNMGGDDGYVNEKPVHPVKITKGYWMGRFEVTQAQWELIMNSQPSYFAGEKRPVEQVSWHDCQKFIELLNGMVDGGGFRLPTEAEWEYACRAGTTNHFSFGVQDDELYRFGNYCDVSNTDNLPWWDQNRNDGNDGSAVVGSFKPNPWGLFDMHGNVWEWCQDWFGESYYTESMLENPKGPATGLMRALRGGSWYYKADLCRSSVRSSCIPVMRSCNIGFRVVCVH